MKSICWWISDFRSNKIGWSLFQSRRCCECCQKAKVIEQYSYLHPRHIYHEQKQMVLWRSQQATTSPRRHLFPLLKLHSILSNYMIMKLARCICLTAILTMIMMDRPQWGHNIHCSSQQHNWDWSHHFLYSYSDLSNEWNKLHTKFKRKCHWSQLIMMFCRAVELGSINILAISTSGRCSTSVR